MASLVLSGDTSGSITVAAPAVAGSNTQTLAAVTGTLAPIVSGTAVSASGTSVDFTGIPSWAKRITVMFNGVSTNGLNTIKMQIGSGSYSTSGYASYIGAITSSSTASYGASSDGFFVAAFNSVTDSVSGVLVLTNITGNIWCLSGASTRNATTITVSVHAAVPFSLGGALDRLRIIGSATGSPSDTFDAGTINIIYE